MLRVGDIVRKGGGKQDWYVTSATAVGHSGTPSYGLSTKPDGQKTGAGYSAPSLRIVRRQVDALGTPDGADVPAATPEATEDAVSAPEKPTHVEVGPALGDLKLTQRSSDYFDSILGNIEMWDGPGLVDAYGGDTGNLTDLKVKGLIRTMKSGNVSFAYLTPKGHELAKQRGHNDLSSWAIAKEDGTLPEWKAKPPTPEQIAERSRPDLTGQAASYWRAVINPGAKITSVKERVHSAGDGDLWAGLWRLQAAERNPYLSKTDAKKIESMKAAIEGQIKYRYLSDPSADGSLGDGTSIDPEDFRELAQRRMRVPTAENLDELLKSASYSDPLKERIQKAREGGVDSSPKAPTKSGLTPNPEIPVTLPDGTEIQVDEQVADLVRSLNEGGMKTSFAGQGRTGKDGEAFAGGYQPAYVAFDNPDDADAMAEELNAAGIEAERKPNTPAVYWHPDDNQRVTDLMAGTQGGEDVAVPEAGTPDVGGPGEGGGDPTPDLPGHPAGQAEPGVPAGGLEQLPPLVATLVKPGDKVYTHPQGATIIVNPDGHVTKYGPDGKGKSTSATAAKLSVGHGQWKPVDLVLPTHDKQPTEPPLAKKPLTDLPADEALVVSKVIEPELPSEPIPVGSQFAAPMTFNEAPVSDVPKYIDDPDFFFQQKVDGIRGQLVIEPGKAPWFRSKSGEKLQSSSAAKITAPMLKQLGTIPTGGPSYTVDGELLDGKWYIFDMTVAGQEKLPWEQRMAVANAWVTEMHKAGLKQVQALPVARTADEKRKLWEKVRDSGAEGVMMKRRDAPYNFDKRVSHTLKAKVTSTADVVVMERNIGGKENARIGIHVNGELKSIGTVSMQGKEKGGKVNVGDVIEVEYLWAMPGAHTLQQPRMVKLRPDKKPTEATDAQLRFVDKSVLDVEAAKEIAEPVETPEAPTPAEAPAAPETPKAPPAPTETLEDPASGLEKAIARAQASGNIRIEGDPAGDHFTIVKYGAKENKAGAPKVETGRTEVTRGADGSLTYKAEGGKVYSLTTWLPDLWKAATAGRPKSYDSVLDEPSLYKWSDIQKADASYDFGVPSRPYPPNPQYSTSKEKTEYYQADAAWQRDFQDAVARRGPKPVPVNIADPSSASSEELEAELKRLGALAATAHIPAAVATDKSAIGGFTKLVDYEGRKAELEVKSIMDAARPLTEEMRRRLRLEVQPGQSDDWDPGRWSDTSKPATRTAPNPLPGDEQKKARDTYVVKDKNTVEKNASLRSGAPSAAAKTWRGKTDRWIRSNQASHDMVLYRGIAVPPAVIRSLAPGAMMQDVGVISTDSSEDNARFYLDTRLKQRPDAVPVMLQVLTPKGAHVVDAEYGEFVMPSNTTMVVRKVSIDDDGTYRITVEVRSGVTAGGARIGGRDRAADLIAGLRIRVHG